jgi:acetate kinase
VGQQLELNVFSTTMNVLVFNPGSSSLKFDIIAMDVPRTSIVRGRKLVSGVIEPIG